MKKKRRIVKVIATILFLTAALHLLSALTLDRSVEYTEIEVCSSELPPGLEGYRIAFISDTHDITAEELEAVISGLNERKPDVLLLGGDYANGADALRSAMEVLSRVQAADGVYGVEGNHDYHVRLFEEMERCGIHPLSNSGARVREGLYVAGVEDLWNRSPDTTQAVSGALGGDFVVLLAHNPDVTMLKDTTAADLILSGHTHGGQITLFGLWAPVFTLTNANSAYGQRFMGGWAASRDGAPVYVGRGTGYYTRIPRVFARPQVVIFTLRAE